MGGRLRYSSSPEVFKGWDGDGDGDGGDGRDGKIGPPDGLFKRKYGNKEMEDT